MQVMRFTLEETIEIRKTENGYAIYQISFIGMNEDDLEESEEFIASFADDKDLFDFIDNFRLKIG